MTIKQIKNILAENKDCKIFALVDFGSFSQLMEVSKESFVKIIVWRHNDDFINCYYDAGNLVVG